MKFLGIVCMEKVTKTDPSDWESIIDFAQVLEQNHPDKSLNEYNKAVELIQDLLIRDLQQYWLVEHSPWSIGRGEEVFEWGAGTGQG